jgi:hypothetical protein
MDYNIQSMLIEAIFYYMPPYLIAIFEQLLVVYFLAVPK